MRRRALQAVAVRVLAGMAGCSMRAVSFPRGEVHGREAVEVRELHDRCVLVEPSGLVSNAIGRIPADIGMVRTSVSVAVSTMLIVFPESTRPPPTGCRA